MNMENKTEIIPAKIKDIELIVGLAHEIWHEHYTAIIGLNQVEYMLKKMYSHEVLKNTIECGTQQFYLIRVADNYEGFIAVELRDEEADCFIQKFYLRNSKRGTGAAKICFDLLKQTYPEINTFRLQVNRENIRAINFYFKVGFIIEKSADFDIGNGFYMNDFVMIHDKNKLKINEQIAGIV